MTLLHQALLGWAAGRAAVVSWTLLDFTSRAVQSLRSGVKGCVLQLRSMQLSLCLADLLSTAISSDSWPWICHMHEHQKHLLYLDQPLVQGGQHMPLLNLPRLNAPLAPFASSSAHCMRRIIAPAALLVSQLPLPRLRLSWLPSCQTHD